MHCIAIGGPCLSSAQLVSSLNLIAHSDQAVVAETQHLKQVERSDPSLMLQRQ